MESDFEELESLLSDHFGRTPLATPCGSQEDDSIANDPGIESDPSDDEFDRATVQSVVDHRVHEFIIDTQSDDTLDQSEYGDDDFEDTDEDEDISRIKQFVKDGCGCQRKCNNELIVERTFHHILSIREMSKEERDMYIMGSLMNSYDEERKQCGKKWKRIRIQYQYCGTNVCKKTFMLVNDIGRHALETLVTHVKKEGAAPRRHGNCGKKPKHALVFDDIKRVVEFIQNFADTYGLPQPAAPRGRDNLPPIYLESGMTKINLHKDYVKICEVSSVRAVKQSCFCAIWNNCLPHVKIASPRDDVCATCEKHRQSIQCAVEENEKIEASAAFHRHVVMAQKERELYNRCIKRAKDSNNQRPQERFNHYTFDFSQNVSIPHFSRQMGPIYFASLRKIQVFGVRIDGQPKQLNFLIDENETIGINGTQTHGPNAVISMLDYVLNTYSRDERSISLHADNCPGQNKNRYMIGYLQWRVMTGQHDDVEYLMQVPGHARCLVDSGFGHLKKLYRRSNIETLDQLDDIVKLSSTSNEAVRYPAWQWRDWKSFLKPLFKSVPQISKHQYFKITKEELGVVSMRTGVDEPEHKVNILVRGGVISGLPALLEAAGISDERKQYLHKTVRPYLTAASRDITCPVP